MTRRRRIPNNTGARSYWQGRVAEIRSVCGICDREIVPGHRINTTSGHGWCHTACIYRERE